MPDTRTLRVVIVESSPSRRAVLTEICREAPAIRVVAEADAVALGAVERTLSPRDLGRAVGAWFGDH